MKKFFTASILCFLLFSISAYAFVQLAPIAAAAIGASLITILGSSTTKVAMNNNGSFGYDGPDLTVPVAVYNTYMQAGADIALGYLSNIPWNFKQAWDDGLIQAVPNWEPILNDIYPPNTPVSAPGSVVSVNGQNWMQDTGWSHIEYRTPANFIYFPNFGSTSYKTQGYPINHAWAVYRMNMQNSHPANPAIFSVEYSLWVLTTDEPNFPGPLVPTYPEHLTDQQAQQLAQRISDAANENNDNRKAAENMVKNNPGLLGQPAQITPSQIQNYAQQAAQSAIDSNIDAIQSALANDPSNVALQLQLAAAQAEAARYAAEQIQQQAETPPEPNYPVPNSWYSSDCNISNGLASCINYQQVIDASHDWQNTAVYQIPNLILQCLGYVQGDGCTHPPSLTIDFLNKYTSSPINIDLSPYVTVVNTVKFFLSILILIGTGRLIMYLFQ